MDDTLEELQTPLLPNAEKAFIRMIAVSVALHVGVFAFLLMGGRDSTGGKKVVFLDLSMSAPAVSPAPKMSAPTEVKPPAPPMEEPSEVPQEAAPSELENMQNKIEQKLQASENHPEEVNKLAFGMGATRGYFRSLGDGETLREDIQSYYFELLQNINEKWWIDKSIDRKGIREVIMNVVIARDGTIVSKQLIRSSGNREYDQAVLKALEATGPLSPPPQTFNGDFFVAPIRLVAPLNLLAS